MSPFHYFRKRLTVVNTKVLEVSDDALCLGISPSGKFVAVGLLDNTVKIFFIDSLKVGTVETGRRALGPFYI